MNFKNNSLSILLVLAIIIVVNLIFFSLPWRWDLTKDKQFTLSKATKELLRDLQDPVTITAYFSKDLPPDIQKTREDLRNILVEYASRSKNMVDFEFVDPASDPQKEQELNQQGIQPVMIQVREKDQAKTQKAYLSALLQSGENKELIPLVQPGAAMEYALTTNIKKMAVTEKPAIALIQGHGEPSLQELSQVMEAVSVLHQLEPLDLNTTNDIPSRFKSLVWIKPTDTIPLAHFEIINAFLMRGGHAVIAFNQVEGDFSSAQGRMVFTGINEWLQTKGIRVESSFVMDATCGTVTVQQQQGFFTLQTPVQFPYLPLISNFSDHPVTKGLEQVIFQFASPIQSTSDTTYKFFSLVQTSDRSATAQVPLMFDISRQWTEADFPLGPLTIGALVENNLTGSRIIVYTDGDFPISGQRGTSPENVNLLVNSIDYLSDDTGLVDLRTKGAVTRPIKDLTDDKRKFLKYLNFLLPIVLVILYGVFRSQQKKNLRLKRMSENYL